MDFTRFMRRKQFLPKPNPETDPIYVTHSEDPSLDEDEMIIHTFVDPNSIKKDTDGRQS